METSDFEDVLTSNTIWTKEIEENLRKFNIFSENDLERIEIEGESSAKIHIFWDVVVSAINANNLSNEDKNRLLSLLKSTGNETAKKIIEERLAAISISKSQITDSAKVWKEPAYNEIIQNQEQSRTQKDYKITESPLSVQVKHAKEQRGPPEAYEMSSHPRGQALIINNKSFSGNDRTRHGSEIDQINLERLLKQLGFEVTCFTDLNHKDFITAVQSFSSKPEHTNSDMCIVVVMSHGTKDSFSTSDDKEIDKLWIIRQFLPKNCPGLTGKPKLFIYQACRGEELDFGTEHLTKGRRTRTISTGSFSFDAEPTGPSVNYADSSKAPTWKDIIIANSTVSDHVSHRDIENGTWFIESICKVFMEKAWEDDLLGLLTCVANEVAMKESELGTKQSCSYENILFTKKLYFNPGFPNQDEEITENQSEENEPEIPAGNSLHWTVGDQPVEVEVEDEPVVESNAPNEAGTSGDQPVGLEDEVDKPGIPQPDPQVTNENNDGMEEIALDDSSQPRPVSKKPDKKKKKKPTGCFCWKRQKEKD